MINRKNSRLSLSIPKNYSLSITKNYTLFVKRYHKLKLRREVISSEKVKIIKSKKDFSPCRDVVLIFENTAECILDFAEVKLKLTRNWIHIYIPGIDKYFTYLGYKQNNEDIADFEDTLINRITTRKDLCIVYIDNVSFNVSRFMGDDNINPKLKWNPNTSILSLQYTKI